MRINRSLLTKIVVFLVIAIVGYFFYTHAFSNYQVRSSISTDIVAGKYPDDDRKMFVRNFEMDINTQKQVIQLAFHIIYYDKGNYSISLTLPYRISSHENLGDGTWLIENAESGSVVIATFEAKNVSEYEWDLQTLSVSLYTQDSIPDNIFETYSISLPFGGSISFDLQEKMRELREIAPITILAGSGFNGTLRLTVPNTAVISGTSLDVVGRHPHEDFQVLDFKINEFKPFYLQYVDSEQRINFETHLLFSGMFFGVAASGFAGILIEWITTKFKNNDKEKSNSGNEMSNQSEIEKSIEELVQFVDDKWNPTNKSDRLRANYMNIIFLITVIAYGIIAAVTIYLLLPIQDYSSTLTAIIAIISFIVQFVLAVNLLRKPVKDKELAKYCAQKNYRKLKKELNAENWFLLKAVITMKSLQEDFKLTKLYKKYPSLFNEENLISNMLYYFSPTQGGKKDPSTP